MTKRSQTTTALRIKELFFLSLLFFISGQTWGQNPSTNGNFRVNISKGCTPLQVEVTNTSNVSPDDVPIVYIFDWDGRLDNLTLDPLQGNDTTYNTPGTYRILQVIGGSVGTETELDSITIEVMEPLAPQFKVYNCINNAVYVDFSEEDYYEELSIDFGDGEIQTVPTSQSALTHAYSGQGAYTITVEGLFRSAEPNCGLSDTTITTIQNLDIATLKLVQVVNEQEIQFAYTLTDPDVSYRLEVAENGSDNFDFASIDLSGNSSAFTWNDPNINTRVNYYCFRIVAVNRCNEALNQYSETVCSIALQASPEDLQNRLLWQSEGFVEYQVNKNTSQVTSLSATEYLDTDVECQQEYVYNVIAEINGASSISLTETVTAISTSISPAPQNLDAVLNGKNAVLTWPALAVSTIYYIYRAADGGANQLYDSLQVMSPSPSFTYPDPQELEVDVSYCYQFSYRDACGNESELSEEVCVLIPRQAIVLFPNAFTPNGDGLNDTFVYKANLLSSVRFQIYNRWGELLFSTEEIGAGWDGSYNGRMAPQGTYLYVLEVVDELGNAFSRSGKFTLFPSRP